MLKVKSRIITAIFAILMCGSLNCCKVLAAGRSIALSPMNQKIVLMPGESYRGGMTVANPATSTENLNYKVEVSPYYPTKTSESDLNYSGSDLVTKTNMNMIVDWITLDEDGGTLAPNEEHVVTFTINVPLDAPAGGQYAALLISEDKAEESIENSVAVNEVIRMGHLIYATITGDTIQEGEILQNDVPTFVLSNALEASALVRNNGNVHTDAEFVLQVWPMGSDEEICTNEENAETTFVMPNTERYYVESCELPIGIFRAKQTVKIFGESSVVEKTIIVCPIWLLFLIIFGIIALIMWLFLMSKKRKATRR